MLERENPKNNPTLNNLENWLTTQGLDSTSSQEATLGLWSFQKKYVISLYGLWLPIGVAAKQNPTGIQVQAFMYRPGSCFCSNPQEEMERLKRGFRDSLQKSPFFELELIPLNQKSFEEIAKERNAIYLGELQDS